MRFELGTHMNNEVINGAQNKIIVFGEGFILPIIIYIGINALLIALSEKLITIETNLLIFQTISNILVLIIIFPLYLYLKRKYNIKYDKVTYSKVVSLVPIGFSLCLFLNIALSFFADTTDNAVSIEMTKMMSNGMVIFAIIIVAIIVPVFEEILFRGLIYGSISIIFRGSIKGKPRITELFEVPFNNVIAIIISSIIFGAAHGNLVLFIYAFIGGIILAYYRYKYNHIIYSIILHAIMNLTSIFFNASMIIEIKQKIFMCVIAFTILSLSLYRNKIKII